MAEQVGEVLADAAGDVVVISLADAAGEDLDECFALAGVGYVDGGDGRARPKRGLRRSLNLCAWCSFAKARLRFNPDKGF